MTLLRFAARCAGDAALRLRWGLRDLAGIGWRRGVVLAALSGPVFSLLMMTGFALRAAGAWRGHRAGLPDAHRHRPVGVAGARAGHARDHDRRAVRAARPGLHGRRCAAARRAAIRCCSATRCSPPRAAAGGCSARCRGAGGSMRCASPASRWCCRSRCSRRCTAAVADPRALLAAAPGFVALQAVAHGLGAGLVAVLAYSRAVVLLGPGGRLSSARWCRARRRCWRSPCSTRYPPRCRWPGCWPSWSGCCWPSARCVFRGRHHPSRQRHRRQRQRQRRAGHLPRRQRHQPAAGRDEHQPAEHQRGAQRPLERAAAAQVAHAEQIALQPAAHQAPRRAARWTQCSAKSARSRLAAPATGSSRRRRARSR